MLIRVNRLTQQTEPELATSWKVENNGTRIVFDFAERCRFPDGSPFTADDVVASFRQLLDPALHSPIADTFKTDERRGEGDGARQGYGGGGISYTGRADRAVVRFGGDGFR